MLFLFLALAVSGEFVSDGLGSRISYEGQQVLRCKFNPKAMPAIEDELDVWGVSADGSIDVRVKTPKERALLESLLQGCNVQIQNLETVVEANDAANIAARASAPDKWFEQYHTLDELYSYYQNLTTDYPDVVKSLVSIGKTAQNRDLYGLLLNPNSLTSGPIFFIDAGIHAREWIAPATLNYIVENLIQEYKSGVTQVRQIMNAARLVFVPVVNPDGYVYTWTNDRMWRKNRSGPRNGCYGTDCNRNFNTHWGQGGSSTNACSDTYMGPSVASELETQAVTNYARSLQQSGPIYGYISFHSYSQLILRPWGWTNATSPNENYLKAAGDKMASDILSVNRRTYVSQRSIQLYVTTGTSSDYFYDTTLTSTNGGSVRVASYTIELRPAENNSAVGFQLPPAEIIGTGQENYFALKNFLTSVIGTPCPNTS